MVSSPSITDNKRFEQAFLLLFSAGWFSILIWKGKQGILPYLAGYAVSAGLLVSLLFRKRLPALFKVNKEAMPATMGMTTSLLTLTYLGYFGIKWLFPSIRPHIKSLYDMMYQAPGPVNGFPYLFIIVFTEELIWRGIFFKSFENPEKVEKKPNWSASWAPLWYMVSPTVMIVTVYAIAQAGQGSFLLVLTALICGVYWSMLRNMSKGIWGPFLCHIVWNLFVFIWFPLEAIQ